MVGRHIHHLPIVDAAGRPVGIVTTTDLLRLEQANPVYLAGDIAKQPDVAGVARVSNRLPQVVQALVEQDASADDIGRVVTAVGDAVERRVIALAEADLGPPPVPYCWVALGSRARLEQALAADQDNAIVIDDAMQPEHAAWFEALATRVTDDLVACGYPRCPGDVMATNPRWRQPLARWRQEFSSWLHQPVPDAILGASIFFDMRPVHGDPTLVATLQRHVLAASPSSKVFLAHLAKQATANEPPLGFFRGFVLEKAGDHRHTLDIKRGGIGAVVELARAHALSVGSPAVNTQARIEAAREAGVLRRRARRRPARRLRVHLVRAAAAPGGPGAPGRADRQLRLARRPVQLRQAAPARGVRDRAGGPVGAGAPLPAAVRLVSLFRRTPEQRRERALRDAVPGPLRDYLAAPLPDPGTPLHELRLLAVDIETTGLDPRRDRVLSIGWLPVDGDRVVLGGAGRVVVRDEGGASGVGQSATVHGLTDDRLAGGVPLEDAVARLLAALAGRVLLAHFARIETAFLAAVCERAWGAGMPCVVVDTFELERRAVAGGWGSRAGAVGRCGCGRPGSGSGCRSTGPTRRSPTRWPAPSSTSPSGPSCRPRTRRRR